MSRYSLVLTLACVLIAGIACAQIPNFQPNPQKLQAAREMESRALSTNDSLLLGKAYFLFGEVYNMGGSLATSKEYYLKAIRAFAHQIESFELGMAYLRLNEGMHLTATSEDDFNNARTALGIFNRIHSPGGVARAYNYLTSAYKRKWVWHKTVIEQFKSDQAKQKTVISCINNIDRYSRLAKDTAMMAEANLQFGDLFLQLNQKRALSYFGEAFRLFRFRKNDTSAVRALCLAAYAHLKFHQYTDAHHTLERAQQLANRTGIKEYWMTSLLYEALVEYNKQTGHWEQAYTYLDALGQLYRYRLGGERDLMISSLNLKYETEKKEKRYQAQANELLSLRLRQRFTVVIFVLLLITGGLSIFFFRLYRKNQRISRWNEELVKEQNHRVKNNLQVVASLLSLQSARLTDESARLAVEESQLRIQSMAILHKKLYDHDQLAKVDLSEFIPELVSGVIRAFGLTNVTVHAVVDAIYLSADKATPLGLILNELITNACKYAFPDNDSPKLWIDCHQKGRTIQLEVADNGPGLNRIPVMQIDDLLIEPNSTFGMSLILTMVTQLDAKGQFETTGKNEAFGTVFKLEFNG